MPIDGEPKDGDYVRYVERLINRGQAAPGQVVAQTRGATAMPATPAPGEVIPNTSTGVSKPGNIWKAVMGQAATTPSAPATSAATNSGSATNNESTADATLATRAAGRRGSFAAALISIAVVWQAMRLLFEALRRPDFNMHELLPVFFLLVLAGVLWKAFRAQRARANQTPGRLPPLTTISKRGANKPGR